MQSLSEQTLDLLRRFGWNEDREVDVTPYQQALIRAGYPVHQSVLDFLRRFGGLHVLNIRYWTPGAPTDFHFSPIKAVSGIDRERVQHLYDTRIGTELCVIGELQGGHMVLLMNESGQVFGGYDEFMVHVADSGDEAIEALVIGKKLIEIPEPTE